MAEETSVAHQPPQPAPGPPYIPGSFSSPRHGPALEGAVLNHVALEIESASTSLAFYVDFLGMSLIFAINAGPFTAYYLGYPRPSDQSPLDMVAGAGERSGLLELILPHDDAESPATEAQVLETQPQRKQDRRQRRGGGLAHLGIRVSDVSETLKLAEKKGWKVIKHLGRLAVEDMPLPSWSSDGETNTTRAWQGGFEKSFGQIGFLEDPDGNWIEVLPKELKR